ASGRGAVRVQVTVVSDERPLLEILVPPVEPDARDAEKEARTDGSAAGGPMFTVVGGSSDCREVRGPLARIAPLPDRHNIYLWCGDHRYSGGWDDGDFSWGETETGDDLSREICSWWSGGRDRRAGVDVAVRGIWH